MTPSSTSARVVCAYLLDSRQDRCGAVDVLDWNPEVPVVPPSDVRSSLDGLEAIDDVFTVAEHSDRKLGPLGHLHCFEQGPKLGPGHHLM